MMIDEFIINSDGCYRLAEEKAATYFELLYKKLLDKSYVSSLSEDVNSWKQLHIQHPILSLFTRRGYLERKSSKGYYNYIRWMEKNGRLDDYLERSISYIYIRDMGKKLDSPTKASIKRVVNNIKTNLLHRNNANQDDYNETISMYGLYKMAEKEGLESTMFWLINKLKSVSSNIPQGMDAVHAERKLIKIIAGVVMQVTEEMEDNIPSEERKVRLDNAIRLGFSFGLTYPFIDDLLDATILSKEEKKQYSDLIRTSLVTGVVPDLGEWKGANKNLIQYVHSELRTAFEFIKDQQSRETIDSFFEQSYVFFHSQEVDRVKDLSNATYTNEELYIPVILKSASSRLIIRSLINAPKDEEIDNRIFYYGIYNQLADDFADMFDDLENNAVTPYTYYWKYHDSRPDLINPFELYWAVIDNLIHNVYQSDPRICELLLDRAINGLKRYKAKMGTDIYNKVMKHFASGIPVFNSLIQKIVRKANNVDFFDKLLRDHMIDMLKKEREEQEDFSNMIDTARQQINRNLTISISNQETLLEEPITAAANYSLDGNGKRIRPIIAWVMGVQEYGLKSAAITPLIRSLEYMHTASLIYDDLPTQDNASMRRGRPTLHEMYNIATAELTGLFLTQKAIEEQSLLDNFDSHTVLRLIRYTAQMTGEMCKGQTMDLNSKGKQLTLEQLNLLCFYKTGIGFEASLIMPAILAKVSDKEMNALKRFSRHAGIAFQIKDDLLDVEGEWNKLGKYTGKDIENNSSTFVSILGQDGARKAMWDHYCLAVETLQEIPLQTNFLKHLLNYIVQREK